MKKNKTVNVKAKHIKKVNKASDAVKKSVKVLQAAAAEVRKATAQLQDVMRRLDNIAPLKPGSGPLEERKIA